MSRTGAYFFGIFSLFTLSLFVSVLLPLRQLLSLNADYKEEAGLVYDVYPSTIDGLGDVGKRVYISEGCQTCHTQFVRGSETADIARGWGRRRTVARDYISEKNAVLGYSRMGPDLANIGADFWRNEPVDDPMRPDKRDANWHFAHLYNPVSIVKESTMPAYKHLFELRKVKGGPSPDSVAFASVSIVPQGYEVVPKNEARALIVYLRALERSHPLREAGLENAPSTLKKD